MEMLGKIIRGIDSTPVAGGFFVLIVGFLPLVAGVPLNLNNNVMLIIGGVLIAA